MKKKIAFTLFITFSSILSGIAQVDSLKALLETTLPDTTRIDILGELSRSMWGINLDSSIMYGKEAAQLAENINDVWRRATMLKNVGIGYFYKSEFVEVLDYWRESLAAFESINDQKGISNLLSNIGGAYNSTGDYTQALDYHLKALRIAEQTNDELRIGTVLQNIGAAYSNKQEYEQSRDYYEQALELFRKMNYEKGIGTVIMNLSEVNRNLGDYKTAERETEEAKALFKKLNDPQLVEAMIAASDVYYRQNKFSEAINESKEALALAKKEDTKAFMQRALVTLGNAYNKTNNSRLAKGSFEEAIELGNVIGVNIDQQYAYEGLVMANEQLGDYKAVATAQKALIRVSKELYDIEKDANISNLQLEFDIEKREAEIDLLNADNQLKEEQIAREKTLRNFLMATAGFLLLLIGGVTYLYQYARKTNKIITEERNKSDQLLKNILPIETAEELKQFGSVKAKKYASATVLFTDFVNFTGESEKIEPEMLVHTIDYYFKQFDTIIQKYGLEKIKTIGDAYMAAGGLPIENPNSAIDTVKAAKEMVEFVKETYSNPPEGINPFKIRIGVNSGPVVAGVVGTTKFQYDIWGDTVNVAARLESNSEANQINVSHSIYDELKEKLSFAYRGELDVKNKGKIKMYFCS